MPFILEDDLLKGCLQGIFFSKQSFANSPVKGVISLGLVLECILLKILTLIDTHILVCNSSTPEKGPQVKYTLQ